MSEKIIPKILAGTRDFLPSDMAVRNKVINSIKNVFIRFGYDEIDTPAIEYAETLLGKYGDEGNKQMYVFEDLGGRKIALRYDQTVPFARVTAGNWQNLSMPFKRYQISKVWRAEKPQKGRLREFYQCDIDIIGTDSLVAEAEVAKIMEQIFQTLGFTNYTIKINSRRFMNSFFKNLNISVEKFPSILRAIDKLGKTDVSTVSAELRNIPLEESQIKRIIKLITLEGSNTEKLEFLQQSNVDLSEMKEFFQLCEFFQIDNRCLSFEPSLARGLDYYTGITYEVDVENGSFGALCGGGRYDNLCSMFTDKKASGVGVAFGFERIMLVMEQLNILPAVTLNPEVLVAFFSKETLPQALKLANEMITAGINTEIYLEQAKLPKQLRFANKKGIPFVAVVGPDEARDNMVTIKNLSNSKQKTIPTTQVIPYIKGYITN